MLMEFSYFSFSSHQNVLIVEVSIMFSCVTAERVLMEVVLKPENLWFLVSRLLASDSRPEFCKWALNLQLSVL